MTGKCGSLTRSADCSHSTIHMGHSGKLCQRECLTGNWLKYSEPQTIWRTGSTQFWETWLSSCFGKSPNFVQSYLGKFHRKICQGFMMANRVLYFLTQIINLYWIHLQFAPGNRFRPRKPKITGSCLKVLFLNCGSLP